VPLPRILDQWVLLWNKAKENPSFLSKFESLWIGLYQIEKKICCNSYFLKDTNGKFQMLSVNG
jgi:hypothetical protein